MSDTTLLHHLIRASAERTPQAPALSHGSVHFSYEQLHGAVSGFTSGLLHLGLTRAERVAVYLEKRPELVIACFASAAAGLVFVPINPLLKAEQVGHMLQDCGATTLVTSPERLAALSAILPCCPKLQHLVLTGPVADNSAATAHIHLFSTLMAAPAHAGRGTIDTDMLSILYTSGSAPARARSPRRIRPPKRGKSESGHRGLLPVL